MTTEKTAKTSRRPTLAELQARRDAALTRYRELSATVPADQTREAHNEVEALQKAVSDAIADGALPCPTCGQKPIGIEQPRPPAGVEYEVGCRNCGLFIHHDGSVRDYAARGGTLPRHAVEAWNEGADWWRIRYDAVRSMPANKSDKLAKAPEMTPIEAAGRKAS